MTSRFGVFIVTILLVTSIALACGGDEDQTTAPPTQTESVTDSPARSASATTAPQATPDATESATSTSTSPLAATVPDSSPSATMPAGPTPTRPIGAWGNGEIYVMNADGSEQRRLTNLPSGEGSPVWSPDGSMLAYVSYENNQGGLYVMHADGTGQHRLSDSAGSRPVWSPDGRWIAITATDAEAQYEQIFVVAVDGSGQQRLTSFENVPTATLSMGNHDPAWSPDGQRIAFVAEQLDGPSDVHVMNADGTGVQRLTDFPGRKTHPVWSPDGSRIAFSTDFPDPDIWVMHADGSGVINLTTSPEVELGPTWSADGTHVIFVRQRDTGNQIVRIAADGSDAQIIADSLSYLEGVQVSPDGRQIVFAQGDPMGANDIYLVNLDGSGIARLTDAPHTDDQPVWSPNGTMIAFGSNRDGGQPVECDWSVISDYGQAPSVEAGIWSSHVVVAGTIVEEHGPAFGGPLYPDQSPDPAIYTDYTLEVERQFRGQPLDTIRLRTHGGTIGECAQDYQPEVRFTQGMRVLLFLGPERPDAVLPPAYFPDVVGNWTVSEDDTVIAPESPFNPEGVIGLTLDEVGALVAETLAGEPPDDAFAPVSLDESPATPQ